MRVEENVAEVLSFTKMKVEMSRTGYGMSCGGWRGERSYRKKRIKSVP